MVTVAHGYKKSAAWHNFINRTCLKFHRKTLARSIEQKNDFMPNM